MTRNVPSSNANSVGCKGITALGNDGQLYTSKKQRNGVYTWKLATVQHTRRSLPSIKPMLRGAALPSLRPVQKVTTYYQPRRQGVLLMRQNPMAVSLSQAAQMRFLQELAIRNTQTGQAQVQPMAGMPIATAAQQATAPTTGTPVATAVP
jgi:hypothetical protein